MNYQARQKLIAELLRENPGLEKASATELLPVLSRYVSRYNRQRQLSLQAQKRFVREIYNTMRGFDILQAYIDDPEVTEIMVNGPKSVFIEKAGKIRPTAAVFDDREHLTQVITRSFGRANRLINEQKPLAGMRLSDGSRVHAVLPPAAPSGPCLAIRRFTGIRPSLSELVRRKSLSPEAAKYLEAEVLNKANIFISGGTGSGKTTFLNALSGLIPPHERIITIEDAAELDLQGLPNLLRLEARQAGPDGQGAVSLEDLIKSSLRLRPDRIIVGEVRGAESFEMIQAMSTGHPGSMSTGHGNNCLEMLDRLALMILMNSSLPWEAIRRLLASTLDLIIHLERLSSGRRVVREIAQIKGFDGQQFELKKVFYRQADGDLELIDEN
ncbi:MAG: ATPase, T2SS/T4P/T4SS family [Eubacteriales bacterium]|nr:ATPase, T2SS/T4P/T4SS family [Eubacteriales bacterium]